ncbi:MAG: rod shape-determining protein RodA [Coriobacteriia bacterium]|nr:rod shape-determining protein RodA [Coriobacteriia bacterium]
MPLPQIDNMVHARPTAAPASPQPARFGSVNVPFVVVTSLLVLLGLVVVYSATSTNADYSFSRQAGTVAVGIVVMLALWRLDYRLLSDFTFLFLIINVVLILSPHLPVIGVEAKGAQSWIKIGIQLQPGEFAKVTVILLAASVMSRYGGRLDDPREYVKALFVLLIPFVCIMTQPDLGTGLVYLFIGATALVAGGARPKFLLITLVAGIAAVAAVLMVDELLKVQDEDGVYQYKLLKNYQRNRLLVFLNPDADTSGSGYNLRQAQIAIGSGGLFGKGLMQGTQASLNFLPEAPTDFIFCVLAEELGFVGVLVLLTLYALLVTILFRIARGASDMFGMLIVMCCTGMWLFQILENIGMDLGLMPITGIPLPFMSFGSSFMFVNFVMLGMIGSVYAHNGLPGKKGSNG